MSDPHRPSIARIAWPIVTAVVVFAIALGGCLYSVTRSFDQIGPLRKLRAAPRPSEYGTPKELGTRGDKGNPRVLFHGGYPSRWGDQERRVGGLPARFSGYTTWVRSVARVPAATLVDGYQGDFLRVRVRVFNRDKEPQHVCACDFSVWSRAEGYRAADAVAAATIGGPTEIGSGAQSSGDVYLYVATVSDPIYLVYNPDRYVLLSTNRSTGIWRVPRTPQA